MTDFEKEVLDYLRWRKKNLSHLSFGEILLSFACSGYLLFAILDLFEVI